MLPVVMVLSWFLMAFLRSLAVTLNLGMYSTIKGKEAAWLSLRAAAVLRLDGVSRHQMLMTRRINSTATLQKRIFIINDYRVIDII